MLSQEDLPRSTNPLMRTLKAITHLCALNQRRVPLICRFKPMLRKNLKIKLKIRSYDIDGLTDSLAELF